MEIEISKGVFTLIDKEDLIYFVNRRWHPFKNRDKLYVRGWIKDSKKKVLFHREILNAPPEKQVDHINGNTLDNRKCNLRLCNSTDNARNKSAYKSNTSGYKGVSKAGKKWIGHIGVNKKKLYLGVFSTKEEAALAYNEAAIKYHGEFAKLNEVE